MQEPKRISTYLKTAVKLSITLFSILLLFTLILFCVVKFEWIGNLPTSADIKNIQTPEASELLSDDGSLITKYYNQNRINLDNFEAINSHFKNSLIATEDIRFYKHNGVDIRSLFRVLFKSILLRDKSSGGGSTLTQQLVKNTFQRQQYKFGSTLINKFREIIIAGKLENFYSKDEIIKLYTNTVSFGERAFGLEVASRRFFNKPSKELSLYEAATLVGILKAPTYYSPRLHPDRAKKRRNVVLSQLYKNNMITKDVLNETTALPLKTDYQKPSSKNELARYFKEKIRKDFDYITENIVTEDGTNYHLYQDGLKIYTSLNLKLQEEAENHMEKHMKKLQGLFIESWKEGKLFGEGTKIIDGRITKSEEYKRLKNQGLSKQELIDKFSTPSIRSVWTWDGYTESKRTKIDSIKHYLSLLHCGILAADPQTGHIKAWVGGNDYGKFQNDQITSKRQVGSTFKPIVYLTALEQNVHPCKFYENELRNYTSYQDWTPKNANNEYGGKLSMYAALVSSVNTISVQVIFDAGLKNVVNMAKRLGIESYINEVPSMVLGTSDISLYEMVNAYAHFANGGHKIALNSILKIENREGEIIYEAPTTTKERIINETQIDVLNSILCDVTKIGTGRRITSVYSMPFDMAGKTGTTQCQSDGWFIGYHPSLVVGSWVGTEDRRIHFRTLGLGSGSNTALPMVAETFRTAYKMNVIKPALNFAKYTIDDCPPYKETEEDIVAANYPVRKPRTKTYTEKIKREKESRSSDLNKIMKSKRPSNEKTKFRKWLDKIVKKKN